MDYENTEDSFITINSIKKAKGKNLLVNNEINFKSKFNYLKPKLVILSQKQLIDIALNDKSWQIRRLALRHIKDKNIVFQIAFNDKSHRIREYFLINYDKNLQTVPIMIRPCLELEVIESAGQLKIAILKIMHQIIFLTLVSVK